eukprot:300631_1
MKLNEFGGYKTCNQCGQTKEGILGDVDPHDGYWYCSKCWRTSNIAINSPKFEQNATITEHDSDEPYDEHAILGVKRPVKQKFSAVLSRCEHPKLGRGTIRYIGRISSKIGIFAGIELDEAKGKHDGRVFNVRYFQTEPNHAVFILKSKVKQISYKHETDITLNETVIINSINKPNSKGKIKYIGGRHDTYGSWFGIELNEKYKKGHNGIVNGKRYFKSQNHHGIMVTENDISHLQKK